MILHEYNDLRNVNKDTDTCEDPKAHVADSVFRGLHQSSNFSKVSSTSPIVIVFVLNEGKHYYDCNL